MLGDRTVRLGILLTLTHVAAWGQGGMDRSKPSAAIPLNAQVQAVPTNSATSAPVPPAQRPARHAEVVFAHGQLSVSADNASLNQILREVGRQTGIQITGGVSEERVFGKYGPASPSDLLATLLDGTGSNVLLIPGESGSKGQLILTPRQGGPTPPNPNAPGFDDESTDNEGVERFRQPNPRGVSLFGATPQDAGVPAQQGQGVPVANPGADSANPANATNPQSPNGVKTPQEIFQQLQLLRQQQQATPETQPAPPQ